MGRIDRGDCGAPAARRGASLVELVAYVADNCVSLMGKKTKTPRGFAAWETKKLRVYG
jgi:hypothetical protein